MRFFEKIIFAISLLLILSSSSFIVWSFYEDNKETRPAKGGVFAEGAIGNPGALNPLFVDANSFDRDITKLLFSGLVKYEPRSKKMVSDLAYYEVLDDGKRFRFEMKPNLLWSDGKEISVEDVFFTYSLIKNENFKNHIIKENFANVEFQKIDSNKIDFILPEPDTFFLAKVALGILPKHVYEGVPIEKLNITMPNEFVSSGPYRLNEIRKNNSEIIISLVANKNYHEKNTFLEKVDFKYFSDFRALKSNISGLNAIRSIPSSEKNDFFNNNLRFKSFSINLPQYVAIFLNNDKEIFSDPLTRRAFLHSTNKDKIINNIVIEADNIETPIFEGEEEFKTDYKIENSEGAFFDAGWKLDDENRAKRENGERFIRKKGDKELEINFLTTESPPVFEKIAMALKEDWTKAGVKVNLNILSGQEFSEKLRNRDYDVLLVGEKLGYDLDTFSYWHSSEANENGQNFSNYKSFVVDNLLESIRTEFDEVERSKKILELKEKIASGIPAIFLFSPRYIWAVDEDIQGISLGRLAFLSDRFSHIDEWFIHEKKDFYGKISSERFFTWLDEKISFPFNLSQKK